MATTNKTFLTSTVAVVIEGNCVSGDNQTLFHLTTTRMIRSDLIARLAELHPQLQIKDAEFAVKVIIDALCSALSKGGRVEIRGFGSFGLNYRPPRQGRNQKLESRYKCQPSTCRTSKLVRSLGNV